MYTPYVQDVSKWLNHFKSKQSFNDMLVANHDTSSATSTTQGLAQESDMFVTKVEPRGPRPPVPSTGIPVALRTVSSSQASVQEAMFDAKRAQIGMAQVTAAKSSNRTIRKPKSKPGTNSKKKQNKTKVKGKATPKRRRKPKDLFGTPGDIFNSKVKKGR